ncbi:MAG: PilZ domain-containing protein [Huintestinicola sp.]
MLNKEKIIRVDIYDKDGRRVLSTNSFSFPRDFFRIKGLELVVIKGPDLPLLTHEENIKVVFEYVNGTRIQCLTKVDISTHDQLNFHVDDGIPLEERRASFKVQTNIGAQITYLKRAEEEIVLSAPVNVSILNINLGGVLLNTDDMELFPEDIIRLELFDGTLKLNTTVLRVQMGTDGIRAGYGCCFKNITSGQEEKIARFIMECQLAERERRRKLGK